MKRYLLEVCVDSAESAVNAVRGGADRLELCADLVIGGTTPGQALFEKVRELTDTPIHVLIRPRYGDFLYTDHEFEVMSRSVMLCREWGADGIVTGCLAPDASLDRNRMEILRGLAGTMQMTLHRAFDMCRDPYEALALSKNLGINTILTSGQKNSCLEGSRLIAGLVKESGSSLEIMAGGGVDAEIIPHMVSATAAPCYHMSGKTILESNMAYRREDVSMGLPGIGEYQVFRTDQKKVRSVRNLLDKYGGL